MATFDDSPSPSPYGTSIPLSTDLPSSIDPSILPKGLPLLGPLCGYTTPRRNQLINTRLTFLSRQIARPLTGPETLAVAQHSARGYAIMSYGPALGALAAAYRTYTTRHNYRWPLSGPMLSTPEQRRWAGFWDGERMLLNGGKWEVGARWGVQARRTVVHLVRGSAYAAMGMFFGGMVLGVYGLGVTSVGEGRDERLEGVKRAMREVVREKKRENGRRKGELGKGFGRPERGQEGQEYEEEERAEVVGLGGGAVGFEQQQQQQSRVGGDRIYGQGEREAGDLWGRHRERIQKGGGPRSKDMDDASPTGGMGMLDFAEEDAMKMGSQGADENSMRGESQPRRRARRRTDGQHDRNRDAPTRASQDSGSAVDDGLSAWERIRRGADSAGPADTGRAPSPSPMNADGRGRRRSIPNHQASGDDNFAFSSSDQERSYAQSEAQNEFDRRLEQERRGGDFSESDQSGRARRLG